MISLSFYFLYEISAIFPSTCCGVYQPTLLQDTSEYGKCSNRHSRPDEDEEADEAHFSVLRIIFLYRRIERVIDNCPRVMLRLRWGCSSMSLSNFIFKGKYSICSDLYTKRGKRSTCSVSNIIWQIAMPKANGIAIPMKAIAPAFLACVASNFGSL